MKKKKKNRMKQKYFAFLSYTKDTISSIQVGCNGALSAEKTEPVKIVETHTLLLLTQLFSNKNKQISTIFI